MTQPSSFFKSTYLLSLLMIVGGLPSICSKTRHSGLLKYCFSVQKRGLSYRRGSRLDFLKFTFPFLKNYRKHHLKRYFGRQKKEKKKNSQEQYPETIYGMSFFGPLFHFSNSDKKECDLADHETYLTRGDLLTEVESALNRRESVWVYGESGSGKTCLVKQLIKRHHDKFSSVLWLDCENEASYYKSLQRYAAAIGVKNLERNSIVALKNYIKKWLIKTGNNLVVYSNLDGDEPFLPKGVDGALFFDVKDNSVVVTSRKADSRKPYKKVKAIHLTIEEIKVFLTQQKRLDKSDATLEQVAQLLQGENILTICLVVSYLVQYQPDFEEFLPQLSQEEDIPSFVRQLHLNKLQESNKDLFSVLSMLGYLAPGDISEKLLAMLGGEEVNQAMKDLSDLGLLSLNTPLDGSSRESYSIDRDIQKSIRLSHASNLQLLKSMIDCLTKQWSYEDENPKTWERIKSQLVHIHYLWKHVKESKDEELILKMLPLMHDLGNYYHYVNFDIKQARKVFKEALEAGKGLEKMIDKTLADIYLDLAKIEIRQNNLKVGVSYLENAEKYNIPNLKQEILCSLGEAYLRKGELDLAEEYFQQVVISPSSAIFKSALIYTTQGLYYTEKMKYAEALKYYQKALNVLDKKSENHFYKGHIYNKIFCVYFRLNNLAKARECLEKSKEINSQYFPHDHPLTAAYFHNLGILLKEKGRYKAAIKSFQDASSIGEMIFPPNHPKNILFDVNLGSLYTEQGKYEKALEKFNSNLVLSLGVGGDSSYITGWIYTELGNWARSQGKYEEAFNYIQESLKIQQRCLPSDHLFVGDAKYHLGLIYKGSRHIQGAKTVLGEALAIYKKRLNLDHRKVKNTLKELNSLDV